MVTLRNETVTLVISTLGAEPQSLKAGGIEYLWQGDPAYWFRRAPLLFPMTGPTKDNKIAVDGVEYTMPGNGFARDNEFTIVSQSETQATFRLEDSDATRAFYPFGFVLTVTYSLVEDGFTASATITAKDQDLVFTFGWHPAFSLDINGTGTPIEEYIVSFDSPQTSIRKYPANGVFKTEPDFLVDAQSFQLSRIETDKGPIVLPGLTSKTATLSLGGSGHGVTADLNGMPVLVVWTCAPQHGQYVCIEPMCSFGDASRPLELSQMPNMEHLQAGASTTFSNTFHVF